MHESIRRTKQEVTGVRAKHRATIATRVEYAEENRDFIKIYLTEFINVTHPASINEDFRDVRLELARGVSRSFVMPSITERSSRWMSGRLRS
jgi:hypothetical protein